YQIVQIHVLIKHYRVLVPRLSRPEPDPTRASDKRANNHQKNPQQKAPAKHPKSETSLLERVVTISEGIRIYVRKYHEPDHNYRRHHDAGDPGIEIDQHLLKFNEAPTPDISTHSQLEVCTI